MQAASSTRKGLATMGIASAVAVAMLFAVAPPASAAQTAAAPPKAEQAKCSAGRNVPLNHVSIQLWTFHSAIGQHGIATVLERIADMGYRNIEPYYYPGFDADELEGHLPAGRGLGLRRGRGPRPAAAGLR